MAIVQLEFSYFFIITFILSILLIIFVMIEIRAIIVRRILSNRIDIKKGEKVELEVEIKSLGRFSSIIGIIVIVFTFLILIELYHSIELAYDIAYGVIG